MWVYKYMIQTAYANTFDAMSPPRQAVLRQLNHIVGSKCEGFISDNSILLDVKSDYMNAQLRPVVALLVVLTGISIVSQIQIPTHFIRFTVHLRLNTSIIVLWTLSTYRRCLRHDSFFVIHVQYSMQFRIKLYE